MYLDKDCIMSINWYNLAKNATDPQTIGEAIAEALADHNNDPNAHMTAGEAIDLHRDNPVIDHPAESVVNDKIQILARAYVAIVDPSDPEAFDTIESAYAYADSVGGGTILITPGTHYLSSVIEINHNINLQGTDRDDCIIVTDEASGEYFDINTTSIPAGSQAIWSKLTFAPVSDVVIANTTSSYNNGARFVFEDCNFVNRKRYMYSIAQEMIFDSCYFDLGPTGAVEFYDYGIIKNCVFNNSVVSTTGKFFDGVFNDGYMIYDQCYTETTPTGEVDVFGTSSPLVQIVTGCVFSNLEFNTVGGNGHTYSNNYFELDSASYIEFDQQGTIFTGNRLLGGTGNRLRLTANADYSIITDNYVGTEITIAGSNSVIRNNKTTVDNDYYITTTSATALNFANNESVYQEPSATKTLTTTVPPAGTTRTLILKQTNTTAKTITFGTGFKTTGTLALGTTANRWFTLIFVSNGTSLIQIARSTAIA